MFLYQMKETTHKKQLTNVSLSNEGKNSQETVNQCFFIKWKKQLTRNSYPMFLYQMKETTHMKQLTNVSLSHRWHKKTEGKKLNFIHEWWYWVFNALSYTHTVCIVGHQFDQPTFSVTLGQIMINGLKHLYDKK